MYLPCISQVHVEGVGMVNVLKENDYSMGDEMPNAQGAVGRSSMLERPTGRQVAGLTA